MSSTNPHVIDTSKVVEDGTKVANPAISTEDPFAKDVVESDSSCAEVGVTCEPRHVRVSDQMGCQKNAENFAAALMAQTNLGEPKWRTGAEGDEINVSLLKEGTESTPSFVVGRDADGNLALYANPTAKVCGLPDKITVPKLLAIETDECATSSTCRMPGFVEPGLNTLMYFDSENTLKFASIPECADGDTLEFSWDAATETLTITCKTASTGSTGAAVEVGIFEIANSGGNVAGSSGVWNVRPFNSETADTSSEFSLNAGKIVCPAGTFLIEGFSLAYLSSSHTARVMNTTDNTLITVGSMNYNSPAAGHAGHSMISAVFTIADPKEIQLEHWVTTGNAKNFGWAPAAPNPLGGLYDAVFASLRIMRLAPAATGP